MTSATSEPDALKARLLEGLEASIGHLDDTEAFDLLKKQFIGEYISSLNSPEYIANQYTKLYFEGVSLFEMLDIVDSITLDEVNETAKQCIDLTNCVDSRMEQA